MWYMISSQDVENSLEKRLQARPDHLARLQELSDEGRLMIAGPHPAIDSDNPGEAGFTGSLVVAEFDSLEAAQAWPAATGRSSQISPRPLAPTGTMRMKRPSGRS